MLELDSRVTVSITPEISVYPDLDRSWDKRREEYYDQKQIQLCQQIEREIRAICQPYRNSNTLFTDFWSVTPGYSVLPKARFERIEQQIKTFTQVYDFINEQFGSPLREYGGEINDQLPTYFRFDAMSRQDQVGGVISAEVGTVPVGEGEVSAMRQVYDQLVVGRNLDQFPGSALSMARLLSTLFGNDAIRIILPPLRMGYLGDYEYVGQVCRDQGLDAQVENSQDLRIEGGRLVGRYGVVNCVYRGFQLSDLINNRQQFAQGELILHSLAQGNITIYPQLTFWDRKDILGRLFQPEMRICLEEGVGKEQSEVFYEMFPWTWNCEINSTPVINGEEKSWEFLASSEARKTGFVLKPLNGRESRGIMFSLKMSNRQWQEAIQDTLEGSGTGNYIIQRDSDAWLGRFVGTRLERETETMIKSGGWRDRLCVNTFVDGRLSNGSREVVIGDIDHTLRCNTRLIHTASDAIHVPTYICNSRLYQIHDQTLGV